MHKMPKTMWELVFQKSFAALVAMFLVVVQSILNVTEVFVLERFIDGFSYSKWMQSVPVAVCLCGIYAFYYIQVPVAGYLNSQICLWIRSYLDKEIIGKVARVSVAVLEDADNQALLARLCDNPERRYTEGFSSVLQIFGGLLRMAGVFALIADNVPSFLLVIVLLLGMMVIVFRLIGRNRVKLYRARSEIGRRSEYLSGILFERETAQEKKVFGYTPYVQKLYEEENIRSGIRLFGSIVIHNVILWFYDNITYLFSASAYLLFLGPLYRKEISIGLYIAIIPALTRLGAFFVSVGSRYLPTYQEYRACRADIGRLYDLPEQYYEHGRENRPHQVFHVMKGENIVFRYSGQKKPVLDGLNFTFYAGKNYALVGENGCGKSTLIKLLLGFYQPESGVITIDGKDIQEMEFGELQGFFSAVFQDFNRYNYTIRENIFLSALGREERDSKVRQASQEAEIDVWITSCPEAYDKMLGNLEEGAAKPSGGQWQRLSIARMLYRRAAVRIWDEPTAAMDPLAESRLYTTFLQKKSEKCVNIFVTHRMGAAVSADEICVLKDGRFVEQGSHAQLMQKEEGLYRRMFQAQKGMYE